MPHTTKMTTEDKQACARVKALLLAEKSRSKITYDQIGLMIGKSGKTVSAIVNGNMRVTVPVARKLANVFGVAVTEILPWVAELQSEGQFNDIIADFHDLSPENQAIARRLIRNLADSQE